MRRVKRVAWVVGGEGGEDGVGGEGGEDGVGAEDPWLHHLHGFPSAFHGLRSVSSGARCVCPYSLAHASAQHTALAWHMMVLGGCGAGGPGRQGTRVYSYVCLVQRHVAKCTERCPQY